MWYDSDPNERNSNGRTRSGLYRIFIPAYDALEGFFDQYGNPVIEDPEQEIEGIDGDFITIGSKTYLKNERRSFKDNPSELNEVTRQFPFTEDEAFRDSIEGSLFNIGKIYQQIEHNEEQLDVLHPVGLTQLCKKFKALTSEKQKATLVDLGAKRS